MATIDQQISEAKANGWEPRFPKGIPFPHSYQKGELYIVPVTGGFNTCYLNTEGKFDPFEFNVSLTEAVK